MDGKKFPDWLNPQVRRWLAGTRQNLADQTRYISTKKTIFRIVTSEKSAGLQFGVALEDAYQCCVNGYGLRKASSLRRGFSRVVRFLLRGSQPGWSGG